MATIRKARHDEVPPLINENCDTLVLGSMLSPKSAEKKFYYAHPQNRFWRVMSAVFDEPMPKDFDECAKLALDNGIALWDVISSCDIIGARHKKRDVLRYRRSFEKVPQHHAHLRNGR